MQPERVLFNWSEVESETGVITKKRRAMCGRITVEKQQFIWVTVGSQSTRPDKETGDARGEQIYTIAIQICIKDIYVKNAGRAKKCFVLAARRDDGDDTRSIVGRLLDDSELNVNAMRARRERHGGEEGWVRVEGRASVWFSLIHRGRAAVEERARECSH